MNNKPKKNCSKTKLDKLYCEKCGFKKRGPNHEEGEHHKKGKAGQADISGW